MVAWVWLCLVFTPALADINAPDTATAVEQSPFTVQLDIARSAAIRAEEPRRSTEQNNVNLLDDPKCVASTHHRDETDAPYNSPGIEPDRLIQQAVSVAEPRAPPRIL